VIPWWVVGEGNVVNVQCYYTEFVKQPVVTLLKKFAESWKVWMTVATVFAAAEDASTRCRSDAVVNPRSMLLYRPGVQQLCDDD